MDKKTLRTQMRRQSLAMTAAERAAASVRLFACVERTSAFAGARTVALYCSLPDEPDTRAVLERWSGVKRIVVPRVEGHVMRFFECAPAALCSGAFGILEPGVEARLCDAADIDLMVVPGTAFTDAGARMGRGGGFYDKYLAQPVFRGIKIGVCYAHQIVGELPVEPHDVRMDVICAG